MHRLLRALSIQASTHQEGLLLRVLCTRVHRAMLTSMQRSLIMSTISVWVRWRQMQEWDTEGQAVRAARLKQSWLVTPCRACTKIPANP